MRQLYVIGLGPGDPNLITVRGSEILSKAEVVFVPYSTGTNRSLALSIVEKYSKAEIVTLGFPMKKDVNPKDLERIGEEICSKSKSLSAFVTLGDPSLYSTFFRVSNYLGCFNSVEIVPGVSSITACASKAFMPLAQGNEAIAIIPADRLDLISKVKQDFETIIVLKGNENLDKISEELKDEYDLLYARRCYLDGEKVIPWSENEYDKDYFSMLICRVRNNEKG
ncbi:cobalt-precorrin-2 C(20)-methyltransferase [Sulfolobus acidocaldarius SUSAZ]|nr:cobalt-precorrin-2 C(20)-methyltransferase [Sulfolobus acidocaldarius SUSAZ]